MVLDNHKIIKFFTAIGRLYNGFNSLRKLEESERMYWKEVMLLQGIALLEKSDNDEKYDHELETFISGIPNTALGMLAMLNMMYAEYDLCLDSSISKAVYEATKKMTDDEEQREVLKTVYECFKTMLQV